MPPRADVLVGHRAERPRRGRDAGDEQGGHERKDEHRQEHLGKPRVDGDHGKRRPDERKPQDAERELPDERGEVRRRVDPQKNGEQGSGEQGDEERQREVEHGLRREDAASVGR